MELNQLSTDKNSINSVRYGNNLIYKNNDNNILILDESGKIGINKLNPTSQLDLVGDFSKWDLKDLILSLIKINLIGYTDLINK